MRRYYFDPRDGDVLTLDEVGLELSSFHAAQEEAARSLADLAREALRTHHLDGAGGLIAVEVRDDEGPILQARFSAKVERNLSFRFIIDCELSSEHGGRVPRLGFIHRRNRCVPE